LGSRFQHRRFPDLAVAGGNEPQLCAPLRLAGVAIGGDPGLIGDGTSPSRAAAPGADPQAGQAPPPSRPARPVAAHLPLPVLISSSFLSRVRGSSSPLSLLRGSSSFLSRVRGCSSPLSLVRGSSFFLSRVRGFSSPLSPC